MANNTYSNLNETSLEIIEKDYWEKCLSTEGNSLILIENQRKMKLNMPLMCR